MQLMPQQQQMKWSMSNWQVRKGYKTGRMVNPSGLVGEAYPATGSEPDMIGRVPSARARGAEPEPERRREKRRD